MAYPKPNSIERADATGHRVKIGSMALAAAEVEPGGTVREVSEAARFAWGWAEGDRLPNALRIGLGELSEGTVGVLTAVPGGPAVLAVRTGAEDGWLVFGEGSAPDVQDDSSDFRSLIENIPVSVTLLDSDGSVIFANAATTTLTGYDRDEIERHAFWSEVVHPEDRWKLIGARRRAVEGDGSSAIVRFLTRRRGPRLAEVHFCPASERSAPTIQCVAFDVTEQSEVEEALFQSEALYRVFLEQSPVGMLHLDAGGTVTFENHQLRQIIGEEADDAWIGRSIDEIEGLDQRAKTLVRQMLQEGASLEGQTAVLRRRATGTQYLLLHGSPIRHPEGGIVGGVVMVQDRTEERRRQHELDLRSRFALAESELRKAALAGRGRQAFLAAAARLLGEASGADRIHLLLNNATGDCCADRARWWRSGVAEPEPIVVFQDRHPMLKQAIDERRALHLHARNDESSSGHLLEMSGAREALWHPTYDESRLSGFVLLERVDLSTDGAPVSWVETERRLVEQLVRLFETLWSWMLAGSRYRQIVDTIDDGLFTYTFNEDGERRYLFVTPQFESLTGYPIDQIAGAANEQIVWSEQVVHEADQNLVDRHDEALREGTESRVSYRVKHRDGSLRWLQEHATPDTDAMGDVIVSGILTDVTEQKAAEEVLTDAKQQAESANRLKSAFIATMSHEIRTPMGAVNGFAELLTRELADLEDEGVDLPPQVIEFLHAIRDNSKRLLTLVNDLFDLSNLEVGSIELRKATVSLHDLVMRCTSKVAVPLSQKGVDLRVQLAENDPLVTGDPQRLEQVLDNLLSNAVKFTDEGWVCVRTDVRDGWITVEVEDTGVGISEEHLDRLFEPFVQEDSRLNRQYEGSGLGLSLARRLLELMAGTIEVKSAKGEGSLFRIRLPEARPNEHAQVLRYRS